MGAGYSSGRYSPFDAFRECNPERCWCQGGHHQRSRYMYVERSSDGRERYHDPYEYMDRWAAGGGGLPGDWKSPGEWTTRDYDRLGAILSEYTSRVRGRQQMRGGGGGAWMGPIMPYMAGMTGGLGGGGGGGGGMPAAAMMMGMAGADNPFFKMPREQYRSHRRSGWEDEIMQRMQNMEKIAKESEERMTGMSNHLYGSDAERQEEMYKRRQIKLWQEIQQAQMQGMMGIGGAGAGGVGLGGAGMGGVGMGMPQGGMPMMPVQAMGMGASQGFAGGGGMGPMGIQGFGGMGQMGGGGPGAAMHGMGGFGMGDGAGMMDANQMMAAARSGMMGGMGGFGNGGGMGLGMGRRGGRRPRRNLSFGGDDEYDDDDEDFGGGGGGGGGGFGRRGRRRRRGGLDDGNIFGAGFGDGE
ncbi:hypothetical protein LTR65_008048 [Meristemomyces frigidus]